MTPTEAHSNVAAAASAPEDAVRAALADLTDPEIPILTLFDLGIIRFVRADEDEVTVGIAPTYTGCPATEVIEASVIDRLKERGYRHAEVERVLSPPWTTDWISDEGRQKLLEYGIAPPDTANSSKRAVFGGQPAVGCPRCSTTDTERVSEFGSTPCKALYRCRQCREPFEYFKCL